MNFDIYMLWDNADERAKVAGVGLSLVTAKRSLSARVSRDGLKIESHEVVIPLGDGDSYRHKSHMPLGFAGDEVQPKDTARFITTTQVLFRPERLVIESPGLDFLEVVDVRIGQMSQFAACAGVPATMFANGQTFECCTAQVGQDVTVIVRNKHKDTPFRVDLAMMGLGVW